MIHDRLSERIIAIGRERNGLYLLRRKDGYVEASKLEQLNKLIMQYDFANKHQIDTSSLMLWHRRFGHILVKQLHNLFQFDVNEIVMDSVKDCSICPLAKQNRLPFPISSSHNSQSFDLVHLDLWGSYRANNEHGFHYFLMVVDDYSQTTWLYLLWTKEEVVMHICDYLCMVNNQFDKSFKVFRSDNRSEFCNAVCCEMLAKLGIIRQTSCVASPQQNEVVKRKHWHLLEVAWAMKLQVIVSDIYWVHCVLTACYLINLMPSKVLHNKNSLWGLIWAFDLCATSLRFWVFSSCHSFPWTR